MKGAGVKGAGVKGAGVKGRCWFLIAVVRHYHNLPTPLFEERSIHNTVTMGYY